MSTQWFAVIRFSAAESLCVGSISVVGNLVCFVVCLFFSVRVCVVLSHFTNWLAVSGMNHSGPGRAVAAIAAAAAVVTVAGGAASVVVVAAAFDVFADAVAAAATVVVVADAAATFPMLVALLLTVVSCVWLRPRVRAPCSLSAPCIRSSIHPFIQSCIPVAAAAATAAAVVAGACCCCWLLLLLLLVLLLLVLFAAATFTAAATRPILPYAPSFGSDWLWAGLTACTS